MSDAELLVQVIDLEFAYRHQDRWLRVLDKVSFGIGRGEAFGLVGESGCGKSTVAYQLLGYRPANSRVEGGTILFKGRNILTLKRRDLDRLRGGRIGLVPQNPAAALSPGMRVGRQLAEMLAAHGASEGPEAAPRTVELFRLVGLPNPERIGRRYPHQLSGGQQQRVTIAMALACDPDLVVLDEPTTGLDVTTQEQIIRLLADLRARIGMSMFYVTHDLGVLAEIADRVGVMYAGHLVEVAPTTTLFECPRHPYTRGLIASIPRIGDARPVGRPLRGLLRRGELPPGCPFQPRCDFAEPSCATNRQRLEQVDSGHWVACQRWRELANVAVASRGRRPGSREMSRSQVVLGLEDVSLSYGGRVSWAKLFAPTPRPVVSDVSFTIDRGETFALVGESGSGKSTIARAISGLIAPTAGCITFEGRPLPGSVRDRSIEMRRRIQYIFQNPDASLNPRRRIGAILARPLQMFFGLDRSAVRERVAQALDDVRLDTGYIARFPDELSGGERQRVAIARALVSKPDLLLSDEILSSLDVSVQARILELLQRLRERYRVAMLFITHDLVVVRALADRVGVLFQGQLMEIGGVAETFAPPYHPYTHSLLMAVPGTPKVLGTGAIRPASETRGGGPGCVFAGRCPWRIGRICDEMPPPWREAENGLRIRCHIPLDELVRLAVWRAGRAWSMEKPQPPFEEAAQHEDR